MTDNQYNFRKYKNSADQHADETHILTQAHALGDVVFIVPKLQEQIVGNEMRAERPRLRRRLKEVICPPQHCLDKARLVAAEITIIHSHNETSAEIPKLVNLVTFSQGCNVNGF